MVMVCSDIAMSLLFACSPFVTILLIECYVLVMSRLHRLFFPYPIERRAKNAPFVFVCISVDNCLKGVGKWNFVDGFCAAGCLYPDKNCADRSIKSFEFPLDRYGGRKPPGLKPLLAAFPFFLATVPENHCTQGAPAECKFLLHQKIFLIF